MNSPFTSAIKLIAAWTSRDDLYAGRSRYQRQAYVPSLDGAAIAAIRDNRRREVNLLSVHEQAAAWIVLNAWSAA